MSHSLMYYHTMACYTTRWQKSELHEYNGTEKEMFYIIMKTTFYRIIQKIKEHGKIITDSDLLAH